MPDIPANSTTPAILEGGPAFGTYSGVIETAGDHDWIKVTLNASTNYRFYLHFQETGDFILGDSTLQLRDAAGNPMPSGFADDGGVFLNSVLSFTPSVSGTYFIDVGVDGDNAAGAYSLFVATAFGTTNAPLSQANDNHVGAAGERILGGIGSDYIDLVDARDALGEQGNDIILGNANVNFIAGGLGDDTISGGGGADFLFGDFGNDVIFGGSDEDTIRAGAGNDIVDGDTGADHIFGGLGNDYLTGGTDATDRFYFVALADSTKGAQRDVIRDFINTSDEAHN